MATVKLSSITFNGHQATGKLSFHDFEEYEKWAASVNYTFHGFRVVSEWVDTEILVCVKPKLRYKTLRHTLEMSLHMWAVKNGIANTLVATGPIGIYISFRS
jgi:hypothetical protein